MIITSIAIQALTVYSFTRTQAYETAVNHPAIKSSIEFVTERQRTRAIHTAKDSSLNR